MLIQPIPSPTLGVLMTPKQIRAIRWRVHAKRTGWLLFAVSVVGMGLAGPREMERKLVAVVLKSDMLDAHNSARQQVGLGPMVWSEKLAADARVYATEMSRSRRFAHSPVGRGDRPQGENLWTGTRDAYSYDEMAGEWVDERQAYRGATTDQAVSNGTIGDTGHYTQIIWRDTRQVGCAIASNAQEDYLVCRYLPAGNVMGESPLD